MSHEALIETRPSAPELLDKALRSAQWGLYFGNTAVFFCALPFLRKYALGQGWTKTWSEWRRWSRYGLRIFGIETRMLNPHGVELDAQYIIVSNHRSWFDQMLLGAEMPRPVRLLSKKAYLDMPVFGHAARLNRVVPVENGKLSEANHRSLEESLESGESIVLFPEGTRGQGRELLPFRPGAFRMAAKSGVPILPLYIFNSEQRLSKHRSMLTVNPGAITCVVGKPVSIPAEGWESAMADFEREYRRNHDEMYEIYTRESS